MGHLNTIFGAEDENFNNPLPFIIDGMRVVNGAWCFIG